MQTLIKLKNKPFGRRAGSQLLTKVLLPARTPVSKKERR
jgi:hypothetical protein